MPGKMRALQEGEKMLDLTNYEKMLEIFKKSLESPIWSNDGRYRMSCKVKRLENAIEKEKARER